MKLHVRAYYQLVISYNYLYLIEIEKSALHVISSIVIVRNFCLNLEKPRLPSKIPCYLSAVSLKPAD